MRVDIAKDYREMEQELGLPKDEPAMSTANPPFVTPVYDVPVQ
ncbi:MAG: hypothetical protein ACREDR_34360 [Blastocatellia bacterium]